MTMKPRFPRPKAIWLPPLSHQFTSDCPLTTLRKVTMLLWRKLRSCNEIIFTTLFQFQSQKASVLPDLPPPVLTHPSVSTCLVWVDWNWLRSSVTVTRRSNPIILILTTQKSHLYDIIILNLLCTTSTSEDNLTPFSICLAQ